MPLRHDYSEIREKKVNQPLEAVVDPTWPNRLELGSQNMRSKHKTTLFKFPNPKRCIAESFHSGSGGVNSTILLAAFPDSLEAGLRAVICFKTPNGSVHNTTSPGIKVQRMKIDKAVTGA